MPEQFNARRFTDRARKVMKLANDEAHRLHHDSLELAHLLLGMAREGSGVAANVLKNNGMTLAVARAGIERRLPPREQYEPMPTHLPVSSQFASALTQCENEAIALNHRYVGTEHQLLALCEFPDGPHAQILADANIKLQDLRNETLSLLGYSADVEDHEEPSDEAEKSSTLEFFLDPGTATPEEVSSLLFEISKLYRLAGGRGIQFRVVDAREPNLAEHVQ